MKVAILTLFALLIAAAPAKASPKLDNVQDLVNICRSDRDIDDDVCVEIIGAIVNLMFQNETASWTTCGPRPTDGAARQAFLNCGQQGEPCVEPATHRYPQQR
jgi:hypothetical protein